MAAPTGISVSADVWNTAEPTWTDLTSSYSVTGWRIDRGRVFELDKTGVGTASVDIIDTDGSFDVSQFASLVVDVGYHIAICLDTPVTAGDQWVTLFRGYVSDLQWELDVTGDFARVRIECVDAFDLFSKMEMPADGSFGDSVDNGNIVFDAQNFVNGVQRRIGDGSDYQGVLTQALWPTSLREVFTGNVWLQETVYAPRTTLMTVLADCVDAEQPIAANHYMSKDGKYTFHGRLARFDPSNPDYGIATFKLGDHVAALVDPTDTVLITPPFTGYREDSSVFNAALALPQDRLGLLTSADIAGQYVTTGSTATYGLRTWSAENLLTGAQDTVGSTTELEATKLFADYIVDNYSQPITRIGALTVRGQNPSGAQYEKNTWSFLQNVEIGDIVQVSTTHFGYQGYDEYPFFVEGLHYEATGGIKGGVHPDVTLTLDVSDTSHYGTNPFEVP